MRSQKESASCVILESSAEPCDTERLTGKTAANKVDIRQGDRINGSCVCKIYFSFRGIHGVIRLLCVFIYFAVADTLKTAEPFKPRTKAADACEHIQNLIGIGHPTDTIVFFVPPRFPHIVIPKPSDSSSSSSSVSSSVSSSALLPLSPSHSSAKPFSVTSSSVSS